VSAPTSTRTLATVHAAEGGHWFSRNPSKAWGEKFFLAYSPFWMIGMGVLMQTGTGGRWGDLALNLAILALAAPAVVVPALIRDESLLGRAWHETYWFKFNLWIAIFATIGSYFGSEYFFDVLGMIYNYPQLDWRIDSKLLGSGQQTVPLIMYASAYYYFLTYHTCAVLVMRRVRTSRWGASAAVWPLIVLAAAYGFAYLETYAMAGGSIAEQFGYRDLPRMLRWGSLIYACYFVVSFPMVYRLDEHEGESWSLARVCFESLAAGMLVLFLLDFAARFVGTL
jgi:cycloeucalenol cycloisomerase